ncbi:UBP1-associated protein 2A [Heracleum sosnowskyi]|uniref:UBP1-associated protein 2A n=1 Tax=Heracleum sosnowskyi TaxID=360622 RepID=A0AAD8J2S7_9APIA|nr:UBP1-associated protein 2A [Heracleum sosnowskyi]
MAKKRKVRSTPTPQQPIETEHVEEPQQEIEQPEEEEPQQINDPQVEQNDDVEEQIDDEEQQNDDEEQEEEEEEDPTEEQQEDQENQSEKDVINGSDAKEEEDVEPDEQEPVEKLIEPFSKEQLAVLVKEAVEKFPEFIESVQRLADADPAHRKIFVHGLGWDTNAETLISEFSKYGEVEDCKAVTDKVSGKSKGYGFILFKHRGGAQKALKEPQKKIGNRVTSCQLASAGPVPAPAPVAAPVSEYTQRKIFVSNVSADIEPAKLVEFFGKFGEIEDGPLGLDKQTGKPKGFALFVYKTVESAKKALEEPHKTFEGHTLHCQRAIDGPKPGKGGFHQQHQQHQPQQHHHQGYHHVAKKSRYSSGGGGGHLMAPSGPSVGYNPGVAPAGALTPALGQALTALLATQGAGLGNLLGGLGGQVNQGMPGMNNAGYGNQGGYGGQHGMQGGYQNPQMGPGSSRPQQGGGSYMGHGH